LTVNAVKISIDNAESICFVINNCELLFGNL
jgi:hypothetical protein